MGKWVSTVLCCAVALSIAAGGAGALVNVRAFGARGDGLTKDTRAVQAAISAAEAGGGGEVVFPAGRYLCGTIHLPSNLTIRLLPGAVIAESPDDSDFDPLETLPYKTFDDPDTTFMHHALLAGDGIENVAIVGHGIIDGNRTKRGGPKPISLKNCRHVTIRDVTVKDSPSYSVSLLGCDDVLIDGVQVVNSWADGIDPDCCRNVRIANCTIDSADDAICLKSSGALGKPVMTENVTVTNCVLATDCNGFKTGTESRGGFRHIAISNCVMNRRAGEPDGSGVAIESVDGAVVDNVTATNITMNGLYSPFYIRLGARCRGQERGQPGSLQNVTISDVESTGSLVPSMILGIPGHPVRGIMLCNVHTTLAGGVRASPRGKVPEDVKGYPDADRYGVLPAYGLYARHAEDVTLDNVEMRWAHADARPAMVFNDVHGLRVTGFRTDTLAKHVPALSFVSCTAATITGCAGRAPRSPFARVSGALTRGVAFLANDLGGYDSAVSLAPDTVRKAVQAIGNTGSR